MQSESGASATIDGTDSFGSKKLAGRRDGRDFLYQNGMGLLLRGWRGFPRPIVYRGETAVYRFKLGCFRACGGGEILRGTASSVITGKLIPKCRAKEVLPRQMMAQILSVQKSLQDAETGVTFHTETAWACFCAAGVAFRAQSYSGVKQQPIGSSWDVFGLAGAACDFAGHGIFSYNRETFFKMQSESSTFAIDDGADSFGSKKLAGCRDGRDFLYQNGMGLLLRGWRGFPRPIA